MKLITLLSLIASTAMASYMPADIHCKNERLKASLTQIDREHFLLRVEHLDDKSFSPQTHPDWRGFALVFNRDECSGNFCRMTSTAHQFAAWDRLGFYFDLPAPLNVQLLYSYRFHFHSTFILNGQETPLDITEGFSNPQCLEPL